MSNPNTGLQYVEEVIARHLRSRIIVAMVEYSGADDEANKGGEANVMGGVYRV